MTGVKNCVFIYLSRIWVILHPSDNDDLERKSMKQHES